MNMVVEHARWAMIWEATARKVGNVHPHARFADVEYLDFLRSALAISWRLPEGNQARLGRIIEQSVQETRAIHSTNTNLGIILILAPLVLLGDRPITQDRIQELLHGTTVEDAQALYRAIQLAQPGGMGEVADQDVSSIPTVSLLEAMQLAEDRDIIARQYAHGYAEVITRGLPWLEQTWRHYRCIEAAIIDCQLRWLAEFPDTLIARKQGSQVAVEVQNRALACLQQGGLDTPRGRFLGRELDTFLRADGHQRNPGTTADLITGCLFLALHHNIITVDEAFTWVGTDWL